MAAEMNKQLLLASRPEGMPKPDNFRVAEAPIPALKEGEALLRILYLSLDPYLRGRMSAAKSYAQSVEIGQVMEGGTVAEIVQSRHKDYAKGDLVLSYSGWQTHAVSDGRDLRKLVPASAPVTTALGILGMPGFTAYAGLLTIGKPKPGETVVGARAVGIAGGPAKCDFVVKELGFDACLDHHASDLAERLKDACPKGIDVYFENVGGKVWDAVFPLLNEFARIPVCGLIAQYNSTPPYPGPDRLPVAMREVLSRSLTIRGFIQREFVDQRKDFYREMGQWIREGRVKYREDIIEGLERAPEGLIGLLQGKNFGKLVVKVAR